MKSFLGIVRDATRRRDKESGYSRKYMEVYLVNRHGTVQLVASRYYTHLSPQQVLPEILQETPKPGSTRCYLPYYFDRLKKRRSAPSHLWNLERGYNLQVIEM